jgi:hypothetical protein
MKDNRNVNMLANMRHSPAEGNFHDENGNTLKPAIVQEYNRHIVHADKSDCMLKTYSVSRQRYKWAKSHFFISRTFQF